MKSTYFAFVCWWWLWIVFRVESNFLWIFSKSLRPEKIPNHVFEIDEDCEKDEVMPGLSSRPLLQKGLQRILEERCWNQCLWVTVASFSNQWVVFNKKKKGYISKWVLENLQWNGQSHVYKYVLLPVWWDGRVSSLDGHVVWWLHVDLPPCYIPPGTDGLWRFKV